MTSASSFLKSYGRLAERLLRPIGQRDGVAMQEILKAEKRLGMTFPAILRGFYRFAGKLKGINQAHNHLLLPKELYVGGGKGLVFYAENQEVDYWAIRLEDIKQNDPPVFQTPDPAGRDWSLDTDHLSEFLVAMFYWQAVNGGLRYKGYARIDGPTLRTIRQKWPLVKLTGYHLGDLQFFSRSGQVLCVSHNDLGVAARTKKDLAEITQNLSISLND